jgi:hypothetical protein
MIDPPQPEVYPIGFVKYNIAVKGNIADCETTIDGHCFWWKRDRVGIR